jgi:hypothetical protein
MRRLLGGIVASLFAASAFGAEFFGLELTQVAHIPLEQMGQPQTMGGTRGVTGIYSNTTTFLGQAFANGGSQNQSGNTITRLVADDLNLINASAVTEVNQITFAVANLNATNTNCRARIRFWQNGAGVPGAYLTDADNAAASIGFSFNPFSFAPGVTLLTGNLTGAGWSLAAGPQTIWAGLTFDNNTGQSGATAAQLDNMGVGLFDPPTEGSSTDNLFQTTAAGSFFPTPNPAGALVNFAGNPLANAGWELVPEPSSLALLALGALAVIRRR